jgi:hypothetical protein
MVAEYCAKQGEPRSFVSVRRAARLLGWNESEVRSAVKEQRLRSNVKDGVLVVDRVGIDAVLTRGMR